MRTVVIGGTSGLGLEIARHRAERGDEVVVTAATRAGLPRSRVNGEGAPGVVLDLARARRASRPRFEASTGSTTWCLRRSTATRTPSATYDIAAAIRLATLKLIGYTEVVHALLPGAARRLVRSSSSAAGRRTGPTPARRPCRPSTAASSAW